MTYSSSATGAGKPNRKPILWLIVMFLAPLAFAFWLYYGSGWRPSGRTNHGELIDPARPLPAVAFTPVGGGEALTHALEGKW